MAEAATDLGLKHSKIDDSLYTDPANVLQYVHVDDELPAGDDRLVRDMVQKLKKVPRRESRGSHKNWRHN